MILIQESGEISRSWRSLHVGLLVLGLLACAYFAIHGVHAAERDRGCDFGVYYEAGRRILSGEDPGSVRGYLYLPFFATCMAPLALLPYGTAIWIWQPPAGVRTRPA